MSLLLKNVYLFSNAFFTVFWSISITLAADDLAFEVAKSIVGNLLKSLGNSYKKVSLTNLCPTGAPVESSLLYLYNSALTWLPFMFDSPFIIAFSCSGVIQYIQLPCATSPNCASSGNSARSITCDCNA